MYTYIYIYILYIIWLKPFVYQAICVSCPRVLDPMAMHSEMAYRPADSLLNLERIEFTMYVIQSMVSSLMVVGSTVQPAAPVQGVRDFTSAVSGRSHEPDPPKDKHVSQAPSAGKLRRPRAKAIRDKLWHAAQAGHEQVATTDASINTEEAGIINEELVPSSKVVELLGNASSRMEQNYEASVQKLKDEMQGYFDERMEALHMQVHHLSEDLDANSLSWSHCRGARILRMRMGQARKRFVIGQLPTSLKVEMSRRTYAPICRCRCSDWLQSLS
jgi:hypothetical protein